MRPRPMLGICAVRYSEQHIDTVHIIYDNENVTAEPLEVPRHSVINAIRNGIKIVTLHKKEDQSWGHWDAVGLVTIEGSEFIKLANDRKPSDDLGDIPEY